jgi:hypothetical protein
LALSAYFGKQGEMRMFEAIGCEESRKSESVLGLCSPINSTQLDITMMLALPLTPHDLKRDEVPRIHNMLNLVMEGFATKKEQEFAPCL